MPHSKHLKGHVTYYTIALYFVEFSLITKSKLESEDIWDLFGCQHVTMQEENLIST